MILSVDTGLSNYGCAVISDTGEIHRVGILHTEKSKRKIVRVGDDIQHRITQLTIELFNIIKEYDIKAVLGEMPSFGSQNAIAVRDMSIAVAVSVSVFTLFHLPTEWTTPTEVKQAMTGSKNASKLEMMEAACKRYNWTIQKKEIRSKKDNKVIRTDNVYFPFGHKTSANDFNHIADACGAYEALKHGNIARMYIK